MKMNEKALVVESKWIEDFGGIGNAVDK